MKNKGPKCFKFNLFGHKSRDCTKQTNAVDKQECNSVKQSCSKCHKTVIVNGVEINALIDTGSDLSILRVDRFAKIGASNFNGQVTQFKSIGPGSLCTLGTTDVNMMIDDEFFCAKLHVVSEKVMEHKLLLGNDFLRGVEMRCKGGEVKILKWDNVADENEILKIACFAEVNSVNIFHVNDEDVRNEVAKTIDEYEPRKTKEVDMRVRIILKDEVPVSQNARRLPHAKKAAVHEQIDTWLREEIIRPSVSDYASPIVLVKKKDK